jgi:hypothetical protein
MYGTFKIPPTTSGRLPRHWLTLVDESLNELAQVTNNGYDG